MFDQRTAGRKLVRWKAAIIPLADPGHVIQSLATEVSPRGISLFCVEQLFPTQSYKVILQVPDAMHTSVSYIEAIGKPSYSSLMGSVGQYRTGIKLAEITEEYRSKIDQLMRGPNVI